VSAELFFICQLLEFLFSVYCYREDDRDSMKFYTDPDYFLELWCLEIAKDTENQMKRHKQRGRRTAVSISSLYNA